MSSGWQDLTGTTFRASRFLNLPQQSLHPVAIRVLAQHFGHPGRRDLLADLLAHQVIRQLFQQLIGLPVRRQVHSVLEELRQAVLLQVVGQQQRPAGQDLEDPHVDVVPDAAIEADSGRGVGTGHLVEVALADERVGIPPADQVEQLRAGTGKDVADEGDVDTAWRTSCLR